MNELQFGSKVRQVLSDGTQIDDPSLARLRAARAIALQHQRLAQPAPGLAWAGRIVGGFGGFGGFSVRLLLPLAVLVGGLIAINGGQQKMRVAAVVEIDADLLTDELPLDAFLDKGFETWLKKHAPH